MILSTLADITAADFAAATEWHPKPEGMCRGEVCVPAPGALRADGTVDIGQATQRLGMPLVHDEQHGVWAVGPASFAGSALTTAVAADPPLTTRNGEIFRLSSLRGRKVVLVAWSTY